MASRRSIGRSNRVHSPLLIGLLIATACGSNANSDANPSVATPGTQQASPTATTPGTQQSSPPAAVPEVLRFRAPLVGGGEIDMSTLAGKPVVLWFWAPY